MQLHFGEDTTFVLRREPQPLSCALGVLGGKRINKASTSPSAPQQQHHSSSMTAATTAPPPSA
eukprot:11164018-Lingulodinium_polyedra.AAC.1